MDDFDMDDETPYFIVENREGGSIAPFLIGLAVGAGIALLLAPKSGDETRQDIADGVKRAADLARNAVGDLTEAIEDTVTTARERVTEKVHAAREAVDTRRHRVSDAVEAGRVAARQAREDLEYRLAETKAAYKDT